VDVLCGKNASHDIMLDIHNFVDQFSGMMIINNGYRAGYFLISVHSSLINSSLIKSRMASERICVFMTFDMTGQIYLKGHLPAKHRNELIWT